MHPPSAPELEPQLQAWLREAGHDPRLVSARCRRDASGVPRLLLTEPDLESVLRPRLEQLLGQPVATERLPVPAWQGRAGWVTASVADVRGAPGHAAEQITQALQGEVLQPLFDEDGWILARLEDGLIGWVRSWHLQVVEPDVPQRYAERADARITAPGAVRLRASAAPDASVVGETLQGTRIVRLAHQATWVEIEVPGGRRGWVEASSVGAGSEVWPATAAAILAHAAAFRGVPYVWGGKSPKGFDCSGLVQFVFGLHGVPLPRDSDLQFAATPAVEVPRPGDLVFFGRDTIAHVGIMVDGARFVHARGEVRYDSLSPGAPDHDAELAAQCRGFHRALTQSG